MPTDLRGTERDADGRTKATGIALPFEKVGRYFVKYG
jgi:hypothetical protein